VDLWLYLCWTLRIPLPWYHSWLFW
jgi:hypothetical protein